MSLLLLKENGTVTICHSRTKDLADVTKQSGHINCSSWCAQIIKGCMVKEDCSSY